MTSPSQRTQQALLASLSPLDSSPWQVILDHPAHIPGIDEVVVETRYVGLNPDDVKSISRRCRLAENGKVLGTDGAGIVVAVGARVTNLNIGDRVWACSNPAMPNSGTYQHYSVHKAAQVCRIPTSMSLISAAAVGTGFLTAAITMFRCFGFPISTERSMVTSAHCPWIFITSGLSSTGLYLIQMACHLGLRVITTAPKPQHAYLIRLGANVVLDSQEVEAEADLVAAVRQYTDDRVTLAVDDVGPETALACRHILEGSARWRAINENYSANFFTDGHWGGPTRAQLVVLAGIPPISLSASFDALRKVEHLGVSFKMSWFDDDDFAAQLASYAYVRFGNRTLRPQETDLDEGGLECIPAALERVQYGDHVAGHKVVVGLNVPFVPQKWEETEMEERVREAMRRVKKQRSASRSVSGDEPQLIKRARVYIELPSV